MTVIIDLLCQQVYLTDVIKMTVMTTWVSAGIWVCVHLRPRPTRRGLIFSLVAEGFSRFQGPAPKYSLLHQHYTTPPVLFSAVSEHIINTESSARTERNIHQSRDLGLCFSWLKMLLLS